ARLRLAHRPSAVSAMAARRHAIAGATVAGLGAPAGHHTAAPRRAPRRHRLGVRPARRPRPGARRGAARPAAGVRFSRDGRRLVHWQADALQVRDAATLQPLGTLLRPFAQAPAGALLAIDDAWVADDGHTVTVSIDSMEEPEAHRLVEMDAASGRVLRER